MRVVLLKKLAQMIDGVDLSLHTIGDVLDLPTHDAHLIVAENWAIPDRRLCIRSATGVTNVGSSDTQALKNTALSEPVAGGGSPVPEVAVSAASPTVQGQPSADLPPKKL
jgi:hypothetical protein